MGNVSSRADENLLLRDQNRLAISSIKITNARNKTLYTIVPNTFPATRYSVKKELDDDGPIEYIQDPDASFGGAPNFLLRLSNEDDIYFYFTFSMRQGRAPTSFPETTITIDTVINSLTFLYASTPRELETLVTREFNADPNLHRNPNVDLVGDYSTAGSPVETFEWSWKWRPPKPEKDRGGGWRTSCGFVEYDQRAHKLNTLVSFSFWVNQGKSIGSPRTPSRLLEPVAAPRIRIPSTQSVESRLSDSDTEVNNYRDPPSPNLEPTIPEDALGLDHGQPCNAIKVDISYQKPGEDVSAVEDGPVFRATMKALEQKTGNMRVRMKQVLKRAEAAKETQVLCNRSIAAFMEALRDASHSNANAVQPAIDHYFEKIATEILAYEKQNADNLQKLIIDPLSRFYSNEIKQVDSKKKDFEDESKDFYAYVGKYLGQRQDSLKEKKRAESDSKYQAKRRNFELKRFDYSSFMQDLHGGRKDQEVLSQLTQYANTQAKGYLATAKKVEAMMPQLEALVAEVGEADKEYQLIRTGREEKRRTLEKGSKPADKSDGSGAAAQSSGARGGGFTDDELASTGTGTTSTSTAEKRASGLPTSASLNAASASDPSAAYSVSPRNNAAPNGVSPGLNRFKGYRDLEERDPVSSNGGLGQQRREGLLWSLSRSNHYVDPKGLNKQAWHKYWIVLDQGRLSEYVNWKDVLEQHRDPIDLRMASVREARNAERRFCFEVITPNFTRTYQAPSEDDMRAWIAAINNALQSAFESKTPLAHSTSASSHAEKHTSIGRDLFGKSSSYHGHRTTSSSSQAAAHLSSSNARNIARHSTIGDRPTLSRSRSSEDRPAQLLQTIRAADAGNAWCADCNSDTRVEWVSINLGIVVCIECSGIHRSLGTHISKIRSLTLDTNSFTQDTVELLLRIGNRVSNLIYEATLDRSSGAGIKPTPNSPRDHRLRFITAKYAHKSYVSPLPAGHLSETQAKAKANDLLLSSIKTENTQSTILALALNANPNATDKVRATHAVFLALAAADPAAPGAGMHSSGGLHSSSHLGIGGRTGGSAGHWPGLSPSSSSTTLIPGKDGSMANGRKSFPIAELLLQNGAELPASGPAIPLGRSAQLYIEYKRERERGHSSSGLGYGSGTQGRDARAVTPTPPSSYTYNSGNGGINTQQAPTLDFAGGASYNSSSSHTTAAGSQSIPLRGSSLQNGASNGRDAVAAAADGDTLTALPRFEGGVGVSLSGREVGGRELGGRELGRDLGGREAGSRRSFGKVGGSGLNTGA